MSKLKNGAFVIETHFNPFTDKQTVLAKWDGHHPYVTWRLDEKGNTFLGHYFATLDEAVADFHLRTES